MTLILDQKLICQKTNLLIVIERGTQTSEPLPVARRINQKTYTLW